MFRRFSITMFVVDVKIVVRFSKICKNLPIAMILSVYVCVYVRVHACYFVNTGRSLGKKWKKYTCRFLNLSWTGMQWRHWKIELSDVLKVTLFLSRLRNGESFQKQMCGRHLQTDICHRMMSLRKLHFVTSTYFLTVHKIIIVFNISAAVRWHTN